MHAAPLKNKSHTADGDYFRKLSYGPGLGFDINYTIWNPVDIGFSVCWFQYGSTPSDETSWSHSIIPVEFSINLRPVKFKKIQPFIGFGYGLTEHAISESTYDDPSDRSTSSESYS